MFDENKKWKCISLKIYLLHVCECFFPPPIHFLVDNEKFDITSIFYFSFLYVWALKKLVPIMKKVEVL